MNLRSVVLQTAVRWIVPFSLLFALYAAVKGHNEPGGGFIAGLIAAVALSVYRMTFGPEAFFKLIPIHPRWLIFFGLGISLGVAVIPLFFGEPLLRSGSASVHLGDETVHVVSASAFDAGVLLVVVGVAMGMITRISEELEQ